MCASFFTDAFPDRLDWEMLASPPSPSTLLSPSAPITAFLAFVNACLLP